MKVQQTKVPEKEKIEINDENQVVKIDPTIMTLSDQVFDKKAPIKVIESASHVLVISAIRLFKVMEKLFEEETVFWVYKKMVQIRGKDQLIWQLTINDPES